VGVLGLGLLVVSFSRYFAQDYPTILTITQHYDWTAEANAAAKVSRLITVDVDCASPIVVAAYGRWKTAHASEVAAMAPLPPLGGPWFNPQSGKGVIEAEPNDGLRDLGLFNLNEEALGQVRIACLRYTSIYAHPSWIETHSDLGKWTSHGEPRPIIGFALVVTGVMGISGLLEACFQWVVKGQFRRPTKH
jgi:hypothetical protein